PPLPVRLLAREPAAAGLPLRPGERPRAHQRARGRAVDRAAHSAPRFRRGPRLDHARRRQGGPPAARLAEHAPGHHARRPARPAAPGPAGADLPLLPVGDADRAVRLRLPAALADEELGPLRRAPAVHAGPLRDRRPNPRSAPGGTRFAKTISPLRGKSVA